MEYREIIKQHEEIAENRLQTLYVRELAKTTVAELKDLRNELCLKCGRYKEAHLGGCRGCRWREVD